MKALLSRKPDFDPSKVKANIRMAVTRVRMQQNKLVNSVKIQRRQLAELLALKKYDSARIKVEQAVRDDVSIEGLEVLALFLELIANRVQLIAEMRESGGKGKGDGPSVHCPPELKESITSVLWASSRVGDMIPELQNVKKYIERKFGKDFVAMSVNNAEFSVNQKIIDRLGIFTPSNDCCLEYLSKVAEEYSIQGYDEERLRDPNGIVASAAAAASSSAVALTSAGMGDSSSAVAAGSVFRTPSGLLIPVLTAPRDDLEWRLLQLKRE